MSESWEELEFTAACRVIEAQNLSSALVDRGWRVLLDENEREDLRAGLRSRYPERTLAPLLRRDDSDDIVCAAKPNPQEKIARVIRIHDFAAPGWEMVGDWVDLLAWLKEEVKK